jgi:hypothetical protein
VLYAIRDFANKIGEALGVSDIDEYMEQHFANVVKDGVQFAFGSKYAKT